ncbi:MAG: hypothetical protein V3571_00660 [Pseudodesulfovibrio sp.]
MDDGDLILGTAAGYHFGDVRPFLRSLNESGYAGRIVLFVSETTRGLEGMADLGADLLPLTRPSRLVRLPCNALRHFRYLEHLESAPERYGRILLTDVRDVIFQSDPFARTWADGLHCVLEDRRMTLGACPHNSRWIRGHLGEDALARLADRPISCSGTTLGGHDAVVRYLRALTALLLPFAGGERMAGFDQAAHNLLVHEQPPCAVTLHDNAGPVLTLGHTCGEPALDAEGRVLNETGERAVIVHQYDRKPELFGKIRKRYA